MKKEDIKQTQNSIQLPPPRPRQRESRLARLWFQYCLLTGSWAIEPWEKVLFRTLPPPRSSDSNRKLSPCLLAFDDSDSIVFLIVFFFLRIVYNAISGFLF